MAVLDVAEGGVGKGRSCNWTLTSGFSFMLPRMSMQQSSFTLAGVGRICLIRGGGGRSTAKDAVLITVGENIHALFPRGLGLLV